MSDYLDILKEWEQNTANPVIFDHIDVLFPAYRFVLRNTKNGRRWASPEKLDLSTPHHPNKEKTVVCEDLYFREQGEWTEPVGIVEMLRNEYGLGNMYDVYRWVASRFCLDMPLPGGREEKVRNRRQALLQKLEDYFVWNLWNSPNPKRQKVLDYLHGRDFSDDQIRALRFGFVPSWEKVETYITSEKSGFSMNEMDEYCKVRGPKGTTSVGYLHTLAIPYRCGGDLKGFLFRLVEPSDMAAKYKATTDLDRKTCFFNMPADRNDKDIVIVEGEMDALMATSWGVENVVAIGGSDISGDRRTQLYDALGRGVKEITLCLDLDEDNEGKPNYEKRFKNNMKTIRTILDVCPSFDAIYVARFPFPSDPDEFIRNNGVEAFCDLLYDAPEWWRYIYEYKNS